MGHIESFINDQLGKSNLTLMTRADLIIGKNNIAKKFDSHGVEYQITEQVAIFLSCLEQSMLLST